MYRDTDKDDYSEEQGNLDTGYFGINFHPNTYDLSKPSGTSIGWWSAGCQVVNNVTKYKEENGKAFSYFSIVAKNYLIAENNKNYYHFKRSQDIDAIDMERNIVNEKVRMDLIEERRDFIDLFVVVVEKYLPLLFSKKRDIQVADTILYLFKTRENIENYNKKAIYILIRERTGISSQYITNVITKIKFIYSKLYKHYRNGHNIENLTWYQLEDIIEN